MEQSKPIRIKPKLMNEVESLQPEYFDSTTTWVNQLIRVGLNVHLGLDPCDILRKPNDRKEKNKKESEVLSNTYSSNTINKEKIKKWIFTENQIPQEFHYCKDLIAKFWSVKSGAKSEEAFKLLIGPKGLKGISTKYGQGTGVSAVLDQLEEAIANKWQSITLKNYEAFGRPKNSVKEPADNHPAGKVFTASDIYGEV
jgi:hypothetical protein